MLFDAVISPPPLLSAAKPSDQGEESVLLFFVVRGGTIFNLPMYSFRCVKKCYKNGVKKATFSQNMCENCKLFLKKGEKKTNLFSE